MGPPGGWVTQGWSLTGNHVLELSKQLLDIRAEAVRGGRVGLLFGSHVGEASFEVAHMSFSGGVG